ncbi:MAG: DUF1592 domain-containing protein [Akkermansiaceae bacterium]|nr:DUF1592 domain-containing protein [Akkermansiaceae bacterium]
MNLEEISFQITTIEQAELWQKVLDSLNAGEMPPEDEPQPENQEKADFLDALARTMVAARRSLSDTGGTITMRRLNRREYRNTIEHLTGVRVDVSTLPSDEGSGTFDTDGASQFISSDQIEQYLKLGRSAIGELFERQAAAGQESKVFRVEPENTVNVQSRGRMERLEEEYERYLKWKAEVDKAALAPENQAVIKQLREKYKLDDLKDNLRLYQNTGLLKGAPDPKKFGFRDGNAASFSYQGGYGRTHAYMKHYLQLPHSDRGTYLKLAWGIQRIDVLPKPKDVPPGTYKLRIRAGTVEDSPSSRHFIEIGHPQRVNQVPAGFSSKPLASVQVTGTEESPEIIETTITVGSDTPREFAIQERQPEGNKKTLTREFYAYKRENGYGTPPAIWVDWIELVGPIRENAVKTFRVELEKTVNVKNLEIIKSQEKKYKEKWLPWKEGVDKAAVDPANQEVMAELRKNHPALDADPFQLYRNAERLKGAPDPTEFGFGDPINAIAHYRSIWRHLDYMKHYAGLPHNDQGAYLKLSSGIQRFDVSPDPKDMPPGSYKLRIRAGAVEGSDPSRHFIEIGHPQRRNATSLGFSKLLSTRQISGTIQNPQIIEVNIEIGANTPREVGIQERQPKSGKLLRKEFDRHKQMNGYGTPPAIWVDWMELVGPIQDNAAVESKITRVEPEKTINPNNEKEVANIEAGYARFAEWKKAVDKAAATPENQAIITEIRKTNRFIDHPNRFYTFADRFKGAPHPSEFGIAGDEKKAASWSPVGDGKNLAYHKHYTSLPHRDRGTYLKLAHGTGRVIISHKKNQLPPGSYILRVAAAAVEGSPAERHFIEVGHPQRRIESRNWGLEGRPLSSHQVTGTIENPEVIEIPLEVGTDTIKEFAIQEKQPNTGNLKALWNAHNAFKKENGYGHPPAIWIDWVELEGPLPRVNLTGSKILRVEPEKTINPTNERAIKEMEDAFERFTQWKKGVDQVANTPENQAIVAEIAKKEPHILDPLRFYRYADRLKGTPDARDFGFEDARAPNSANPDWPSLYAYLKHYAGLPHRDTGSYLKPTKGTGRVIVSPEKLPIGNYTLRVRVGAVEGSDPGRHFIQVGHPQRMYTGIDWDWGLEGRPISTNQVTGTIAEPQILEIPLEVRPDTLREFAVQEKQPNNGKMKALFGTFNAAKKKNGYGIPPAIWIDWVELEGPHGASPSGSDRDDSWLTDATGPDDFTRARTILQQFAFKAFRGVEAEDDFLDRLVSIYESRRDAGDSFEGAIELPLGIILASPGFLYLNEPNDADDRRELTGRELAVRLAYFLWSSPPDQELLELASRGELSNPDILRSQVDRLIADSRSDEFVSGFLHQWLDMERLDFFQFDTNLYRDFDESTRSAARQEVYHSFAHLLRNPEGGRLGQLLKSDTVFINGLLATYYGIDGVTGDEFQQVALPADSPRGGLLGMAAIHAMGSDGIESSPVERGAWVLRHLLNDPPPPAPPNVPQLSRLADKPLTTRQKLAAHMEEAQCASCHRKIDPIGFGLENFDAAGKWRIEEHHNKRIKWKIDPSGAFHNGPEFADYFEMRDLIADREEDFARGLTEHLISYGLGRPFGFTDEDLADEIVKVAKAENYSVSAFIQTLVQSEPFHRK